ncbi:MAG: helix-turn-helix domain-containing protein [Coriobacteriales bacterium]|jgi:excisionase family DNA binding protein|nr:helix-turn-helix domain-containing protein [Coriobacteriales bacterium]
MSCISSKTRAAVSSPKSTPTHRVVDEVLFSEYPEVLSIEQVCQALALSPNTVRAMIYQHQMPATKLGGKWRVLRGDLVSLFSGRFEGCAGECADLHLCGQECEMRD